MSDMVLIDHFCGAGGESTGIMQAANELGLNVQLHAVNHWKTAIETHRYNHPNATHYCMSIADIDPVRAIPGKRVPFMWASPECTHHSNARGGRPRSEQSRVSPWLINKWLQELYVDRFILENVPEFLNWGPLGADGMPLKSRKGELFKAWIASLGALGYHTIEWRNLVCADYGDPTTRRRLFLQAVRGNKKIVWPEPTHSKDPVLWDEKPWVPARDIIDWTIESQSIFGRKKPLAKNTIARIEAGIRKFWGPWAEPFLVILRGTGGARSVEKPIPGVTAQGNHIGLAEPFLVQSEHDLRTRQIDLPLNTITCSSRSFGLVEPLIVGCGGRRAQAGPRTVSDPVNSVTTKGDACLVEPFILHQCTPGAPRKTDEPVPTVTGKNGHGLIQGMIVPIDNKSGQGGARPVDEPLSTIVTKQRHGLVQPLLMQYYGNGECHPVDDPMRTVTTKERFALVDGDPVKLDIRFRMLQPGELAGAQGFPKGYVFMGTKTQQVKQIGNAVPCGTAAALAKAALLAN